MGVFNRNMRVFSNTFGLLCRWKSTNSVSYTAVRSIAVVKKEKMKHFVELSTPGVKMPIIGLGTWRAAPEEVEQAVITALEAGYTHIDTAFNYNNEEAIGRALKKWIDAGKSRREDLFITTKLPCFGNRPSDVEKFLNKSLERLQLDYVDLYLIHMPFSFRCTEDGSAPQKNEDGTFCLDTEHNLISTWKAMEEAVSKGLTKCIGLSNFNAEQVQRVYDGATIKPAVLQIELHAYLQQADLVNLCKQMNIAVTAFSPLGSPGANTHFSNKYNYTIPDFPDILGHPLVAQIAEKYNKTPAQILLRHLIQQDIIVIPKSSNPKRIKENINIFDFELSDDDMAKLRGLDRGEAGRILDFLFFKGVDAHPEYPFKYRAIQKAAAST